jgi:RNA polymerase I-specific transcription initiation factor RRN6
MQKLTEDRAEFAGMSLEVSNVDEASSSLHELFDTEDQGGPFCIRRIASVRLLHLGEDEDATISGLYDSILQTWIAPLPYRTPLRVRRLKERLARRIAAEVIMAGTRCRQQEPALTPELGFDQINSLSVPILLWVVARQCRVNGHLRSHYLHRH